MNPSTVETLAMVTLIITGNLRRQFSLSLPPRLVKIAALLRRYSPSLHPLLRFAFLLSRLVTNHDLLTSGFRCAKVVNSTRLYSREPSRLLGNPNRTLPSVTSMNPIARDTGPFGLYTGYTMTHCDRLRYTTDWDGLSLQGIA
jgi:hypothetical protein